MIKHLLLISSLAGVWSAVCILLSNVDFIKRGFGVGWIGNNMLPSDVKPALRREKGDANEQKPVVAKRAKAKKSAASEESAHEKKHLAAKNDDAPKKYTLQDAFSVFEVYEKTISLYIFDPKQDKFFIFQPEDAKLHHSDRVRRILPHDLRLIFPDRFTPDSPEFVVAVASGDYPTVKYDEYDCFKNPESPHPCVLPEDFPPVLQFGSVFRVPKIPSMYPMPVPYHLKCFHKWAQRHEVCESFTFSETVRPSKWDDLIPQVVWRGDIFKYLIVTTDLRTPNFEIDIQPKLEANSNGDENVNVTATRAMRDIYDDLVPRWKGVVWTAEAEREAEMNNNGSLPWANIKFAGSKYAKYVDYYKKFMEYGIPAMGGHYNLTVQSKYKYLTDFGGAGGKATYYYNLFPFSVLSLLVFH